MSTQIVVCVQKSLKLSYSPQFMLCLHSITQILKSEKRITFSVLQGAAGACSELRKGEEERNGRATLISCSCC